LIEPIDQAFPLIGDQEVQEIPHQNQIEGPTRGRIEALEGRRERGPPGRMGKKIGEPDLPGETAIEPEVAFHRGA